MLADNVTVVQINGRNRRYIAHPLFQYDYGQVLKLVGVDDVELPLVYEVQFSNNPHGEAITITGTRDGGAIIPDEYLLSGASVFAWLFLHVGDNDGATEIEVEIPVRRKARPTEGTPTPVQRGTIDQIIADMGVAVDAAEASAVRSESYARGGTNSRTGEDTDNAKYYSELAEDYYNRMTTYVHVQSVASDTWAITHNLDKYPSVTIVDSAGSVVMGECQYVSRNELVLVFSGAFSGKAYLN